MLNRNPVVVSEDFAVRQELRALGLTVDIVRTIAKSSAAAKAEALAVDPLSTPGTLAYINGVRTIRLELIPLGWRVSRTGNVESTVNDALGIQLCFQNVDTACADRDPNAISEKGSGARGLIEAGKQGELFERAPEKKEQPVGVAPVVWMVCVSTEGKNLRAEVSCPDAFEGSQYDGFSKRIFVVDEDFGPTIGNSKSRDDGGFENYEVSISKK